MGIIDLTGQKFGRLLVLRLYPERTRGGQAIWVCQCDCGVEKPLPASYFKFGDTKSCGCIHRERARYMNFKDLTGKRFGRLVVVQELQERKREKVSWLCHCDCGKDASVTSRELLSGDTKSCGCYKIDQIREQFSTHKMTKTHPYWVWGSMKKRCHNPNDKGYPNYGGRGITVCKRWHRFENFWADMGSTYKQGLSIERRDNNKGYNPSNCLWATRREQNLNTRQNRYLTYKGETLTMTEWAEKMGMKTMTLRSRIDIYHWPISKALTTPVR